MYNRTKHIICVVICSSLSFSASAEAMIDASLKLLSFDYEEFEDNGDSFNRETGLIPGVALSLSGIEGSFSNTVSFESYDGQVDYDGQTQAGTPHQTDTDETLLRLYYRLDWSPESDGNSVYGKIAWQQWDRDILPANNVMGLFEQYRWWSYEVGLSSSLYADDINKWQLEFGVSKTDNGTIEIDLADQGFGRPELNLGDGLGVTVALLYRLNITNKNSLGLGMQYHRWKFGKSNTELISNGVDTFQIFEPRSVSNHTIFSLNYQHNI